MKIVIYNHKFDYDLGCKLLKLKYKECPFKEIEDVWDDIIPATFVEIAALPNLEERRIGVLCLGLERLQQEVQPVLADRQVIKKKTAWVNEKGEFEEKEFEDVYELYTVSGDYFNQGVTGWNKTEDCQFVKCKDTSTDRDYLLWINNREVYKTNYTDPRGYTSSSDPLYKITATDAIAWTIQTTVEQGQIEKIVRQGDCILVKPITGRTLLSSPRHLTGKEYLELLTLES